MLEPEGLSPMETLLPRRGEGSGVGLVVRKGLGVGLLVEYPVPASSGPWSSSLLGHLLHRPACWSRSCCPFPYLPTAGSV